MVDAFACEDDAKRKLESLCAGTFHLIEEVRLRHWSGSGLRIDYIAAPMFDGFPMPFFGIEVKSGVGVKNCAIDGALTKPICQCVDYNNSIICDARLGKLNGQKLDACFLFPGIPISKRDSQLGAIENLAGGLRVGFAPTIDGEWCLTMSGQKIWSSIKGTRRPDFGKARKLGSR